MPYNWGPFFIVPSEAQKILSGRPVLRESYDEVLLKKELEELGYPGAAINAVNPWYYRKKNTNSWLKIGESSDRQSNFAVPWDTTALKNGEYEVMGVMHVFIKKGAEERVIAGQTIMGVTIKN